MQPIVIKTINKDGFGDYQDGIVPTNVQPENPGNMGQLGNENEPLLNTALNLISGDGRFIPQDISKIGKEFKTSKSLQRFGNDMYINNDNGFILPIFK